MKGAHANLSSAAWQEIGVKPFFGLSGTPRHSTFSFLSSERNFPMIAQTAEVILYTFARVLDQIGDDRDRVGAGFHHGGAIGPGNAPDRNQRLIGEGAGCTDPFQADHRIRNLLG